MHLSDNANAPHKRQGLGLSSPVHHASFQFAHPSSEDCKPSSSPLKHENCQNLRLAPLKLRVHHLRPDSAHPLPYNFGLKRMPSTFAAPFLAPCTEYPPSQSSTPLMQFCRPLLVHQFGTPSMTFYSTRLGSVGFDPWRPRASICDD